MYILNMRWCIYYSEGFPGDSVGKEPACNVGDAKDAGSILGLGRSPGGGHGNLLQYSCLRIPWTEEPGGLQIIRSQRIGHNWSMHACIIFGTIFHSLGKEENFLIREQFWVKRAL